LKKYHFIAGLPRSGTTLLSTILKQNPKFEASISSPLMRITRSIIEDSNAQSGYLTECTPTKQRQLIKNVFDTYYDDSKKSIAFNTNRGWPFLLPAIKDLYPDSKIILCVRDIGWVLDSFEVLRRKNPYVLSNMFTTEQAATVYSRCNTLLHEKGVVGYAYSAVKEALASEYKDSIMLIDYKDLTQQTEEVIKLLYKFIGQKFYQHNFTNVEASYNEFDKDVRMPGLHTTRRQIEYIERESIIPQDIWNSVKSMNIWDSL